MGAEADRGAGAQPGAARRELRPAAARARDGFTVDRATIARLGISPLQIDNTLYDAFGQRQVSVIYSAINQYHVVMEIDPRYTQYCNSLRDVYVSLSGATRLEPRPPTHRQATSPQRPRSERSSHRPSRRFRPQSHPSRLRLLRVLRRPAPAPRSARPQRAQSPQQAPMPLPRATPSQMRSPIPVADPRRPARRSPPQWRP